MVILFSEMKANFEICGNVCFRRIHYLGYLARHLDSRVTRQHQIGDHILQGNPSQASNNAFVLGSLAHRTNERPVRGYM